MLLLVHLPLYQGMRQQHFNLQVPNRQVNNTLQTSDGAVDVDEMHGID